MLHYWKRILPRFPLSCVLISTTAFHFPGCSRCCCCFQPPPHFSWGQNIWCSCDEKQKKVFPFCLSFLAKFLSSPIKFLVCHTRNKDAFILMQCEVSFAQKVERSKCPRDSRSFSCYMLTLFLALAVLCDGILFSWGEEQTVCLQRHSWSCIPKGGVEPRWCSCHWSNGSLLLFWITCVGSFVIVDFALTFLNPVSFKRVFFWNTNANWAIWWAENHGISSMFV